MARYSGLYSLRNQDWIRVHDDYRYFKKIIQIKHRDIWITNSVDICEMEVFIQFADFCHIAFKEIDIYLDMIWG